MSSTEYFITRVYELVSELKIPLIDERVYDNVKIKSNGTIVKIIFDQDESVIYGFLGLSEYYHSIVIKQKDKFIIPAEMITYSLECV
ncbi:MAG: hypothetical protein KGD66_00465 [Candidatus Lokiarchaeota archaeon]|nr:hypothetical protein [Candidatus Lokiarchaeota archaeon]